MLPINETNMPIQEFQYLKITDVTITDNFDGLIKEDQLKNMNLLLKDCNETGSNTFLQANPFTETLALYKETINIIYSIKCSDVKMIDYKNNIDRGCDWSKIHEVQSKLEQYIFEDAYIFESNILREHSKILGEDIDISKIELNSDSSELKRIISLCESKITEVPNEISNLERLTAAMNVGHEAVLEYESLVQKRDQLPEILKQLLSSPKFDIDSKKSSLGIKEA